MGELHTNRSRQTIAHRAEAARGHPAVWLLKSVELRGPHLMLADFSGDVTVLVLGEFVQPLNGGLRLDDVAGRPIGERLARAPFVDLRPPRLQRLFIRLNGARTP